MKCPVVLSMGRMSTTLRKPGKNLCTTPYLNALVVPLAPMMLVGVVFAYIPIHVTAKIFISKEKIVVKQTKVKMSRIGIEK